MEDRGILVKAGFPVLFICTALYWWYRLTSAKPIDDLVTLFGWACTICTVVGGLAILRLHRDRSR